MIFQSIHPTEVTDEDAASLFLVLADRWASIPADELARAFVRCSVYYQRLPERFHATVAYSNRYGLWLDGLEGAEAFETNVRLGGQLRFAMAAAASPTQLVSVWSKVNHYGNQSMVDLEAVARQYRERVGHDHKDALNRARAE